MHESSLVFGESGSLVGTVCHPPGPPAAGCLGVLLFNAGVVHRVGPHRVQVKLARTLASQGVPSMRFDLHGMGDSARASAARPHREQVVLDLRQAMDCLQRETGVSRFAVFGFCSGALPGVDVAQVDPRVVRLILYDGFAAPTPRSRWRFALLRLRARGLGPRVLARVLPRAFAAVRGFVRARASGQMGDASETLGLRDLAPALGALARRGVDVVVLNAGADFSQFNYGSQALEVLESAGLPGGTVRSGFLEDTDHVVTTIAMQRGFVEWVCADLVEPPAAVADLP